MCVCVCVCVCVCANPFTRMTSNYFEVAFDKFRLRFFLLFGHNKSKKPYLHKYLILVGERIVRYIVFPKV